ncbi:uncharacterized protein LOC127103949 [Lathyrus oleraceus]|uniref:uncharacterized protein LOC127103949 n=1 Tax=Pisum sativum TaxID=3888 RepID=UPI0021D2EFE7|nr:uncharacterized protein LOC127103949 [Pisum sativum]
MAQEDMEKTTFITPWGTFFYMVMPFRLNNVCATYQRAMDTLFHNMIHREIKVYVDDMIAKSQTEEEYLVNLEKLFERVRKFKLRLNPNKCTFGVRSDKLIGFIVSQHGNEVDPKKVKDIQDMPPAKTEKVHISPYGHLCADLQTSLKGSSLIWNDDCQRGFVKIEEYLQEPPILMPHVPGKPLIMYLTILEGSMGFVFGQHDEPGKKEHVIYYLSKKFTDCESRYSMLKKTCYALAWAAKRLRQYMLTHTTLLISKVGPIKYIFERPALTDTVARWKMVLTEIYIQHVTQKVIKGSILSDYLAQQPLEDYLSMHFEFLDEDIMLIRDCIIPYPEEGPEPGSRWTLVFDGAFNAHGNGIGAVITSPTALVISQVKGDWDTRDHKLIPYKEHVLKLTPYFDETIFHRIPRKENQLVDALATLVSMFKVKWKNEAPFFHLNYLDEFAYCLAAKDGANGYPWFYDIIRFLGFQEYSKDASITDKKYLQKLSSKFFLSGGVLYKRNYDSVLLRCVNKQEANQIITEIHEGSFGTHVSGHTMVKKILRAGYYWMTMEVDYHLRVQTCHKFQIYADKIHVQSMPLNVLTSPWPFVMWGIGIIGSIEPTTSNGQHFILVAIDYFTKWVESVSYANVTRQGVAWFIRKEIIYRYGIPNKIITYNGFNLNNKMMKELC